MRFVLTNDVEKYYSYYDCPSKQIYLIHDILICGYSKDDALALYMYWRGSYPGPLTTIDDVEPIMSSAIINMDCFGPTAANLLAELYEGVFGYRMGDKYISLRVPKAKFL